MQRILYGKLLFITILFYSLDSFVFQLVKYKHLNNIIVIVTNGAKSFFTSHKF